LELRNIQLDNLYYANWRPSLGTMATGGTPGTLPAAQPVAGLYINELMAVNDSVIVDAVRFE